MSEKYRSCNSTCPDYYSAQGFTNLNLCTRDDKAVIFPECRFKLLPLAQTSTKCTADSQTTADLKEFKRTMEVANIRASLGPSAGQVLAHERFTHNISKGHDKL